MLVKEYFELEVSNKPYKYQTKLNMVRCLKKLDLWEMEYESVTPALCWERIDGIINQNVKRVYAGYVRNIFNYGRNQIPVVMGESKVSVPKGCKKWTNASLQDFSLPCYI